MVKTIKARDLKIGSVFRWDGKGVRVSAVGYADGRDGDKPTMIATNEHTKSAFAIKVIAGDDVYFIHPAQDVTLV